MTTEQEPKSTALAAALRLVARRPRTRLELTRRLTADEHSAEAVEEALERLQADGYVDDFRLAREFIVARAARLRHSRQRLLRDLEARGVPAPVAGAAWKDACDAGDVDPRRAVRDQLRRHLARAGGSLDVAKYRSIYNALLRAGHERELVAGELASCHPETDGNP